MKTTLEPNTACIDTCNSLLRGELAAVETYVQAITKFEKDSDVSELRRILVEHTDTDTELHENVISMGGTPSTSSGVWGGFANAVQATASLFGEGSAIASLIQGEKHGQREYEAALSADTTMPECRPLIATKWLPRVCSHIDTLEKLG
ncbi:MAG: DUF2383 domain-containing protein [Verrucomicrobiales bacterium]|nr:DUF2383 domain-containing protein [Verrucomicrobiales bacterium]MCP5560524.1 DUF2383 domain-containing protein [Verrucomicrobiaceae bacterium]